MIGCLALPAISQKSVARGCNTACKAQILNKKKGKWVSLGAAPRAGAQILQKVSSK